MISRVFKSGVTQSLRNKKLLLTLFVINVVFAIFLTLPIRSSLNTSLGHSLMSERLVAGFDFKYLFEFLKEYNHVVNTVAPLIFFTGIVYLLLSTFLTGGIIEIFSAAVSAPTHLWRADLQGQSQQGFTLARFMSGCGRLFPRYVKLLLISIVLWLLVFILYIILKLPKLAPTGTSVEESLPFWLGVVKMVLTIFAAFLVNMILDYAKIITAVEDRRKMFRVAWDAVKFVFQNLGRTLGLYYLVLLVGIIFLGVYLFISGIISTTSGFWIFVLFLIQQLYILSKLWVRMTFYSSQIILYSSKTRFL